jgi:hypothetical protein
MNMEMRSQVLGKARSLSGAGWPELRGSIGVWGSAS